MISGSITDTTGGLVAGATVRAINLATNVVVQSQSNAEGVYTLSFVPIGPCRVEVEKAGFKMSERSPVEVQVGDTLRLSFRLEVGAMTEKVEVSATTPLLNQATASSGNVEDDRRIKDLPLEYGAPIMLQYLTPGFSFVGDPAGTHPYDSATADGTVNGSMDHAVEEYVDGVLCGLEAKPRMGILR